MGVVWWVSRSGRHQSYGLAPASRDRHSASVEAESLDEPAVPGAAEFSAG
jgi:hypothetical protein